MDTPKDVRKQFIISSIEIRLRVANWGSALEHRFYAGRSKALYSLYLSSDGKARESSLHIVV